MVAIASHERYFRLLEFRQFWFNTAEQHPVDRSINPEHLNTRLMYHRRNINRIKREIFSMTKKSTKQFKWQGYVNIDIPASHVGDAKKFIADDKNVWYSFNQIMVDGYQVKVYFDNSHENFKCVLTCYADNSPNFGYALSAFGDDWYTAIAVVLFKHYELTDGNWNESATSISNPFG